MIIYLKATFSSSVIAYNVVFQLNMEGHFFSFSFFVALKIYYTFVGLTVTFILSQINLNFIFLKLQVFDYRYILSLLNTVINNIFISL